MSHYVSPPPSSGAALPPLHRHAALRMKQRGILPQTLSFVLDHADRVESVGCGVEAQYVSRRRLAELRRSGAPAALLERAQRLTVLLAPTGGVVTVYRRPFNHHSLDHRPSNRRRAGLAVLAAGGAVLSGGDDARI